MKQSLLTYIYTVFLGILIVTFIGLGIDTFYPGPDAPEYPATLDRKFATPEEGTTLTDEEMQLEENYQRESEAYMDALHVYNRNVSIISLVFAIVTLAISLWFSKQLDILADGVMFGGILTLGYGIIRGFSSEDPQFRFVIITVGLIVAIVLGYIRFVKPQDQQNVA